MEQLRKIFKIWLAILVACVVLISLVQPVEAASKVSKPTITSVSNVNGGPQIKWKKVKNASGYYVYRKTSGSYKKIATIKSNATVSYTDKKASNGTTYTYKLKAYKGKSTSSYSKTKKLKCVKAPTISSISNTSSGMKISWGKISKASKYRVYYKKGNSWVKLVDTKSTSYTDKKVSNGSAKTYAVRAINGSTFSGYSTAKSYTRITAPKISTATNVNGGIQVKWGAVSKASQYAIYYKNGSSWIKLANTKSTSYVDKTAKSGYTRTYMVRTINGSSYSTYSNTKSMFYLSTPTVKVAKNDAKNTMTLSWAKVPGATSYTVYRKVEGGSFATLKTTTSTSYTDNVKTGVKYSYAVRATKSGYMSSYVETAKYSTQKVDSTIVAHYKVVNGKVVDQVSGNVLNGATVNGSYFSGGSVTLPANYSNWTYQMIADYNESSSAGIVKLMKFWSNSGKYEECDNVFKLNELNLISSRGSVRVPWVKDSWNSGYTVTIPVQLYAHSSTKYEYLSSGDIFWSFSMNSEKGVLNSRINGATAETVMSTYTDANGNTKYVSKVLPSSFAFTNDHKIKEVIIYNKAQTIAEQEAAYKKTGIVAPTSGINEVVDGLTDMGSSFYIKKDKDGNVTMLDTKKTAGTYTVSGENGLKTSYTITDYVHPDLGIDNSKYESVHITNEPKELEVGRQYPLTAYPYPFRIQDENGKADQFDVKWTSSNSDIVSVIDGLLIPKKAGVVDITATLTGTAMKDVVRVTIVEPKEIVDKPWAVPSNYISKNGYSFSDTDYEMTTRAIYDAIDEAKENGYNHIIFPKQNFYAAPLMDKDGHAQWYYVPSDMTIEFPEGSVFYMMDTDVSRGDPTKIEVHYFHFGVKTNEYGKCENSHLIMDKYYGERYNSTHSEKDFLEELRFVNFGRRAVNCSVEIRDAYYPAGYFLVADGTSNTNKTSGVMTYGDFVPGWLNDNGEIIENENWYSTKNFIKVPDYQGTGYFISAHGQDSYAGKYWGGCSARQYDILWFDSEYNLIEIERFQGRGEYYDIPENAVYCKVALQQSVAPGGNGEDPYIAMHSDGAAKMCEIKNTNVYNSATGVFSVVGQTDGLWIHDCYTNRDGMKPLDERTGDFENGWTATRHSVVNNNYFIGYFANPGSFNTFMHTNFFTNYSGFSGETEMMRYINNTTDYIEVSEKSQAHIFNNTIYSIGADRFNKSIGHIYKANNKTGLWVRSY